MPASEQSLADEAPALKRLLLLREAELLEARLMVEMPKLKIARYKRQKFGASSERLTQPTQLQLLVEELGSEQARSQEPVELGTVARKAEPTRPARKALPTHLSRGTLVHEAAAMASYACLDCGGTLRVLG
jgi:transposase